LRRDTANVSEENMEIVRRAWEAIDRRAQAREFVDAGDFVIVDVVVWARGRGSGVEAEMSQGHLCTVQNGRVTRVELFENKHKALEAAGLEE
jgi:ketosteroid isomerase-like protein